MKLLLIVFILCLLCIANAAENEVEPRDKGEFALWIHIFYVMAIKLFILKIIYGAIFYVLVTKAWHFGLWFVHYLKEKKHEHYEYIEDHHEPYYEHDHGHHGYGEPYAYSKHGNNFKTSRIRYGNYGNSESQYGEYENGYKMNAYDADGSYSVKN
ncbi:hypothetical protein K1T71_001592 [Dendrolimus kikuchii]|uniref:Uncharacterized protein n=1 Tax=Dendrolimus kikuchii TaxID=765133 RepID=A0ACC1DE49_9NEOP|nr:hypothetical protein K1T71_001592 [Dendrolimus kikuchii]